MGIPFEKLRPPRWGGEVPEAIKRDPLVLGPNCVVDPPVILSPMAAVTNAPYRRLCQSMGAGLTVTEMVSDTGLIQGQSRTLSMIDLHPDEGPVGVQIFGREPQTMARAARVAQEMGADVVDVNMGCPMRKVVSRGQGAALLREPRQVRDIFEAMSEAVDIPVTGKTRAGWEGTDAIDVARAMQEGGAAALTIHGRTRSDHYDGHADLRVIKELVDAVDMPVIGNGDVCDWVSARRMFHITGCAAVMVARGALGNPWVFREIGADLRGEPPPPRPTPEARGQTIRRHVDAYVDTCGEERTCREIRKHLLWYFRDTPGERVLRRRLSSMKSLADVHTGIDAAIEANREIPDVAAKNHPRTQV